MVTTCNRLTGAPRRPVPVAEPLQRLLALLGWQESGGTHRHLFRIWWHESLCVNLTVRGGDRPYAVTEWTGTEGDYRSRRREFATLAEAIDWLVDWGRRNRILPPARQG